MAWSLRDKASRQKGEKIQVEARVFEWTSARNSMSASERTKNSWCQWMKEAIQIQDSEEEYRKKTKMAKEMIITQPLTAWTMWTCSPGWISKLKISQSCWSHTSQVRSSFWGSQWPSAPWLPTGCSSSCCAAKKCLETQNILPDNVKTKSWKSLFWKAYSPVLGLGFFLLFWAFLCEWFFCVNDFFFFKEIFLHSFLWLPEEKPCDNTCLFSFVASQT